MAYPIIYNCIHYFATSFQKQLNTFFLIGSQDRINLFQQSTENTGFPARSVVKNLPAYVGDAGSTSGSGRSSGEGNGNLL